MNKKGWAVVDQDGIDIRTVGPTKRSAVVNWLVVNGTAVFNSYSDAHVFALWECNRGSAYSTEVNVQTIE